MGDQSRMNRMAGAHRNHLLLVALCRQPTPGGSPPGPLSDMHELGTTPKWARARRPTSESRSLRLYASHPCQAVRARHGRLVRAGSGALI